MSSKSSFVHTTDLCCDSKHVCTSLVVCIFKTAEILHVEVCFAAINACLGLFWLNGSLTSFVNSVAQLSSRDLIVCVGCLFRLVCFVFVLCV